MKKIYIIEDQDDIRQLLRIYFERLDGYAVSAAAVPSECPLYHNEFCECPQDASCGDVLLVDNYLPKMTGLEFIQRQKAKGCKGSIRNKAVMSADFTTADIALARELGCKLFPKPFRLKEISDWVESATRQPLSAPA